LVPPRGDRLVWPSLPMGKLKRCPDDGEDYLFLDELSFEELLSFYEIMEKPEGRWTRREHKFVQQAFARKPGTHLSDDDAKSGQMEHAADRPDAGRQPANEKGSFPPRPIFES